MSIFQKKVRQAVDAVKAAAAEATHEDVEETVDVAEKIIYLLCIAGITIAAIKHSSKAKPANLDIPHGIVSQPASVAISLIIKKEE